MSFALRPLAEAHRVSNWLDEQCGQERFPVDVQQVALDYSRRYCPGSPIDRVYGDSLEGLEGLLTSNGVRTKWLIAYNTDVPWPGRIRFTIAHEFGHYLLHRQWQTKFMCSEADTKSAVDALQQMEQEADQFASALLMPMGDLKQQVAGQPISFELLETLQDRYGVSLTAMASKWIDIARQRAVLVTIKNNQLQWARSSTAAYRSGAVFATRRQKYSVPLASSAHSVHLKGSMTRHQLPASTWFPNEPEDMPLTELIYRESTEDFTLAILLLPDRP